MIFGIFSFLLLVLACLVVLIFLIPQLKNIYDEDDMEELELNLMMYYLLVAIAFVLIGLAYITY